jgi:hypothetical protein
MVAGGVCSESGFCEVESVCTVAVSADVEAVVMECCGRGIVEGCIGMVFLEVCAELFGRAVTG